MKTLHKHGAQPIKQFNLACPEKKDNRIGAIPILLNGYVCMYECMHGCMCVCI